MYRTGLDPMHVGLNLLFLVPGETGGMEIYARELIPALLSAAPNTRFTAFVNRETAAAKDGPWGELLPAVTVPVNARSRMQWVLGEQALLPPLAARRSIELLHSLASTAPALGPFRRVVTVHDLIYARFPETHGGVRALGMRALVPLAVRSSHRVIADSLSTQRDLEELLHTRPEQIDVVPLGFRGALGALGDAPGAQPPPTAEIRARLDLGDRRILLSLSAKRPHKNLLALLEALAAIPRDRRPLLVLPGYRTSHEAQLRQRVAELALEQDVRLLGWVDGETLEGIWSVAAAFVYPSLYEGFGLPILEAMARGVPVACSNASSLPEVAGNAALLFDPRSEAAIAKAIERVLYDDAEARRLRIAGLERVRAFTWERTAQLTLASYARALASNGAPSSSTEPNTVAEP